MALLFIDSFDHYATADLFEKWTTGGNGGTGDAVLSIGSGGGRRSTNSLRILTATGGNRYCHATKTLSPVDPTTCIAGCAIRVPAGVIGASSIQVMGLKDGATTQVGLRVNPDLTLSVFRGTHGSSPTVLGTTSATLTAGSFGFIEWSVLIHPSAGTTTVRLNGAAALTLTGQNTRSTAASQWTSFVLGMDSIAANSYLGSPQNIDHDDIYIVDASGAAPWNAFLGDCRVDARLPTGAGATTAWTPSTGSNWQNVDDAAPDDDTTYNSSATVAQTDTFVVQDAPVVGATIYGVQHCVSLKKSDAGTCTVAPVVRHSSTDYPRAAIAPGTSYAYGLVIDQVNPGTSAQWTEAGFNAAEFGYKRTA